MKSKPKPIRIVILDDHRVVRAGIKLVLEEHPDLAVVADAASASEAIPIVKREKPDVIILDLDLGGESGLASIPALMEASPDSRILILTGTRDPNLHMQAVRAGALGVAHKEASPDVIAKAVREVHRGAAWLDHATMATLLSEFQTRDKARDPEKKKIESLSARELEVVELVGAGLKARDIAARLFISEVTVRHHLTSIFGKLEVSDRVDLMMFAYKHGLARIPGQPGRI